MLSDGLGGRVKRTVRSQTPATLERTAEGPLVAAQGWMTSCSPLDQRYKSQMADRRHTKTNQPKSGLRSETVNARSSQDCREKRQQSPHGRIGNPNLPSTDMASRRKCWTQENSSSEGNSRVMAMRTNVHGDLTPSSVAVKF